MIWTRSEAASTERFLLSATTRGYRLAGTVALVLEGRPALVDYAVTTDGAWRTVRADVRLALGAEPPRRLRLEQRADEWWRDAEPLGIDGCPDVDLVVTPATNTLPIRRLGLQAGETATIRALWIRVPSLELVVAEQEYACHAPGRYRYRAGSFAADLEVDEDGLVVDYAGIWRRAAEETAPGRPRGGPVG